jgi:hypothetical protein
MNIIPLFTVPVFVVQLENNEAFLEDEVRLLQTVKLNKQYGEDANYLSEESHVLEMLNLTRLRSICDYYVNIYANNIIGIDAKFKMFRSWLAMNVDGSKHHTHSHGNTMISCVLYFDETLSNDPMAPINFYQDGIKDIFKTHQFQFKTTHLNQYNSGHATVIPKTNTMIIFPGWIKHGTEINQTNTKRYCLGTNYFFEGEVGEGYHNINIKIN